MKKQFIFSLLIFILLFTGCPQKNEIVEESTFEEGINFVFQQLLYKKYNKCDLENPSKFYLSDFVYNLLTKKNLSKNGQIYLFEKYNPDYITLLDSYCWYDPATDDASWVEQAISQANVEIVDLYPVNDFSEYENDIFEQAKEIRYLDEKQRLKLMKFGEEVFIPQKMGDKIIFINSSKNKLSRNIFDKDFRLLKIEKYKRENNKLSRSSLEEYSYDGNSLIVNSKKISTDNTEETLVYNKDGLVIKQELYDVRIVNGVRKTYFNKRITRNYDSNKRVIKEAVTEVINGYRVSSENRYRYKREGQPPDNDFYENGALKIRTTYSSNSNYVKTIFFDDEMRVSTYYVNNRKVKDTYFIGDEVLREKYYE